MKKSKLFTVILSTTLLGYYHESTAQNWLVAGNSATSTNFLGTTNAQDLRFRTNNTQKMVLTQGGNLGVGLGNPAAKIHASLTTTTASTPVALVSTIFDGNETRLSLTGFGLESLDGTLFLNGTKPNDVNIALGGGNVSLGKDAASTTLLMKGSIQGGVRFDAFTGDKISLYGDRLEATNMYGLGVENASIYYKSMGAHRWYINKNADGGAGAAMTLSSAGKLGIGVANPGYKLHVVSNEQIGAFFKSTYSPIDHHAAIAVDASGTPGNSTGTGVDVIAGWCGVYSMGYLENSQAQGGGSVFGVWGVAIGPHLNTGNKYGIYGEASYGAVNYAGYFNGNVYASQYFLPSDKRLKNNIQPAKGNLDKLMLLKPSTYDYKTKEFSTLHLPENTQLGLVADDLEKVFPELVQEQVQPPQYGKNKEIIKPEVHFKGVNYIGLIPVLISSVQEQQIQLDSQNEKIEQLERELIALKNGISSSENINTINLNEAHLQQNAPNPFSESTTISYFIPETVGSATIKIYSINGEEVRSYTVTEKGKGTLIVNAGSLSQGTYTYQLIINNQTVDTKLMVLTK